MDNTCKFYIKSIGDYYRSESENAEYPLEWNDQTLYLKKCGYIIVEGSVYDHQMSIIFVSLTLKGWWAYWRMKK
jgi:hypothetical protein